MSKLSSSYCLNVLGCNDASKRVQSQTCLSYAEREHLRSRTISTAKVRQKRQPVVTQIAVELSQIAEDDRNSPLSAMLRRLSVSGRRRPAHRHRRSGRVSVLDRVSGPAWV